MANSRGKDVDKTFLSADHTDARLIIHRDLIAHSLRWSHVARLLGRSQRYASTDVLDVGCGVEVPLGKMLYSNKFAPRSYVGVDVTPNLKWPEMLQRGVDSGKLANWQLMTADVATLTQADLGGSPNFITMFEVVEHVEADHRIRILTNLLRLAAPNATLLVSTPNYDHQVGAANNHVDETTAKCFGALLEDCGWSITAMHGTFASIKDYKDDLIRDYGDAGAQIFTRLHEYYDTNLLATIFAPLYPFKSRNIIWSCQAPSPDCDRPRRRFPRLAEVVAEARVTLPPEADASAEAQAAKAYLHSALGSSAKWEDPEYVADLIRALG